MILTVLTFLCQSDVDFSVGLFLNHGLNLVSDSVVMQDKSFITHEMYVHADQYSLINHVKWWVCLQYTLKHNY